MFRKDWTTSLLAAVAALFLVSLSPAHAQNSSRVIETVGVAGTQQVASALATNPAPRSNFALAQAAGPERRIALVIGNSNYEAAKALPNPANDAKAVSQLFNQAGFEVVMAFDLNRATMRQVIGEFAEKVKEKGPNSVALIYYAGHGLQVDGDNYLVPVDARFEKESDVAEQGVRLADLMATLEAAPSKVRIVILDACRNNPFSALNEVAGKGLAIVDAPAGSIVAYSTAPGTEAFDGQGTHSPYAAAFMRTIKTPNLPIEQVFKKVRVLVDDVSGSKQMPWESTSLTSDFVFFTNANVEVAAVALPKVRVAELRTRSVRDAYEVVVAEDSVEYYEEFVRLYPSDPLCDYIRRALSRRLQMIAWHKATKSNNASAYAAFLAKHGNSDFANAAKKLQQQPKLVTLPKFDVKIGNTGIKTAPVIPFPKNGQNGIGTGIKTGPTIPVINNGQNGQNGTNGVGIKPGTVITPNGQNSQNSQNSTGIKTGNVIPAIPQNGNTGIAGGIKPKGPITGNVTTLPNTGVVKPNAGQVATLPPVNNASNKIIPPVSTKPVLNNPQVINKPVINSNPQINRQVNIQPKVIQSQPRVIQSQPRVIQNNAAFGNNGGGGGIRSFGRR